MYYSSSSSHHQPRYPEFMNKLFAEEAMYRNPSSGSSRVSNTSLHNVPVVTRAAPSNSDYAYARDGVYSFDRRGRSVAKAESVQSQATHVKTAISDSLERGRVPHFRFRSTSVSKKPKRKERPVVVVKEQPAPVHIEKPSLRNSDYAYNFASSGRSQSANPYSRLPQYRLTKTPSSHGIYSVVSEDALTMDDDNRLPDVFGGQTYYATRTPQPPNYRTLGKKMMSAESEVDISVLPNLFVFSTPAHSTECLNKRLLTSDSLYELRAIPSVSQASVGEVKLRDFSRQSLEDLAALPSLSSYWDTFTAVSNNSKSSVNTARGIMDDEETDVSTANEIVSGTW